MARRVVTQEYSAPPLTDGVLRLLVLFILAFILEKIAMLGFGRATTHLALGFGPDFQIHQILTHFFYQGSGSLFSGVISMLFGAVFLWSFGGELERLWGSYHFLRLFLVGLVGGALLCYIASFWWPGLTIYGFVSGTVAVLLAYAVLWPERQVMLLFVIPIRMRWLILIILILMALGPLERLMQIAGGVLSAALFLFYYAKKGSTPKESSATIGDRWAEFKRKRRLEKKRKEIERRINLKEEVDTILDKISKTGMKSLSGREKKLLDQASKEL